MEFADALMLNELEASIDASDFLSRCVWAQPLRARTKLIIERARVVRTNPKAYRAAPVTADEKSLLFELRVARDLALQQIEAVYEFATGVGSTAVDFRLSGPGEPWLVELVSLRESKAFKAATWQSGSFFGYALETGARDPRQSGEGELLKAQERIVAKAFDGRRAIKFPKVDKATHVVLVDARGFMGDGQGDEFDWSHIAFGAQAVPPGYAQYWTDPRTGKQLPIAGLFEKTCPLRGADIFRSRIHVVGFVCEKTFAPGEIAAVSTYRVNPDLFDSSASVQSRMAQFPLLKSRGRSAI